jgi:hypothetical protein
VTSGLDVDPDGYVFTRDGVESLAVSPDDGVDLPDLELGAHTIRLSDVAPHCSVVEGDTSTGMVVPGATVEVRFQITCPDRLRADLAVVEQQDGNAEIYALSLRSFRLARLTNDAANDADPSWSSDEDRIDFASDRSGVPAIYIMNADGTGVQEILKDALGVSDPASSPDGSRLELVRDANVYVVGADGTGLTQLTTDDDVNPEGVPGSAIVAPTARGSPSAWEERWRTASTRRSTR